MWKLLLFLTLCFHNCVTQVKYSEVYDIVYEIAGLFEPQSEIQQKAFNESMPHDQLEQRQLEPIILRPSRTDSYTVWRTLCENRSMRPIAIFGPQNAISDGTVRDQCTAAQIPHIQAAWQPFDPDLDLNEEEDTAENDASEETKEQNEETPTFKKISINFYPDADEIALAYAKLLKYYQWEGFAVLYEDDFGLLRVQKILAEHTDQYPVIIRRLDPDGENDKIFKELMKYHVSRILLDCHVDRIRNYMSIAQKLHLVNPYQARYSIKSNRFSTLAVAEQKTVNRSRTAALVEREMERDNLLLLVPCYEFALIYSDLMAPDGVTKGKTKTGTGEHYILVSMDTSILAENLTGYSSNITWLSLIEYDKMNAQHSLAPRVGKWIPGGGTPPVTAFEIEALIMDDVAKHVLEAARAVEKSQGLDEIPKPNGHVCDESAEPWAYGALLQNEILKTQTMGVTGNVQFNETGHRVNYTLYVNEIHMTERNTIGQWESSNGDAIIVNKPTTNSHSGMQASKHFLVISRKEKPYFYDKEPCEGEDCEESDVKYEGFSVDLVEEIFKQLRNENFDYRYSFIDQDKSYGQYNPVTKKWDGLIGDLLDKKADLAVCDLTITEERKKVVDFSVPIMSLGISILYTKDRKVVPDKFTFLNPYSLEVWMYIATAYCVVSICLFICARISPADWENPQPCDKDPEELENIWNFKNCTWLTMGSIMTQGCDILPKAIGTRWVCGMWWFFAVIVCQTYIAQLSASMTSALEHEPINSVEDLAKQTKILYGAYQGGSTFEFFRSSKDKMYRLMYETMAANPAVLVSSNDEGERRVINGKNKYAFFMESSTIDYKLKRNCGLKKVGGELDSKDYGIAMPANSPFRSHINRAILKLKEMTILDKIKTKWWEKRNGAMICDEPTDVNDMEGDLEMENLIGAFLVLIMGIGFSLLITAAEFMNEVRNIVVREQVSHKEAFIQELKASLNFFQLQKPVLRNPSRAPSIALSEKEEDVKEKLTKRAAAIENFMDFEKQVQ